MTVEEYKELPVDMLLQDIMTADRDLVARLNEQSKRHIAYMEHDGHD